MDSESESSLTILEKLDVGGSAQIYRARLSTLGGFDKIVAVKQILPHLLESKSVTLSFLREIRLVSKLEHPNIVHVFQTGKHEGSLYLVMEYIQGKTLSRLIKRCKDLNKELPLNAACFVLSSVARGLSYAHGLVSDNSGEPLSIIHRDISPNNIMLSYRGDVKILDFGIARRLDSTNFTETGTFKGTAFYASPEQTVGEKIDPRTDIFSLGIVAYELLTGIHPFDGNNSFQIIRNICEKTISAPSSYRAEIPSELDEIVLRCLVREREGRFQSANELYRALTTLRNHCFSAFIPEDLGRFLQDNFAEEIKQEQELRFSLENGDSPPVSSIALESPTRSSSMERFQTVQTEETFQSELSSARNLAEVAPRRRLSKRFAVEAMLAVLIGIGIALGWAIGRGSSNQTGLGNPPASKLVPAINRPGAVPGLLLAFQADTLTLVSGQPILHWISANNSRFSALQTDPDRQPTFIANALNNKPAIRFDGSSDFLALEDAGDLFSSLTACTIVSVFNTAALGNEQMVFEAYRQNQDEGLFRLAIYPNGKIQVESWANLARRQQFPTIESGPFYIVSALVKTNASLLFLNGKAAAQVEYPKPVDIHQATQMTFGQDWDPNFQLTEFFNGSIAEILLYDHALSDSERQKVENYLSRKYALPLFESEP